MYNAQKIVIIIIIIIIKQKSIFMLEEFSLRENGNL